MKKIIILIFLSLFLFSCEASEKVILEENLEKNLTKKKEIKEENIENYWEIKLDIDEKSDEYQNNVFILDEKFSEIIKKIYNWELKDFNEFEKLKRLDLNCWKYFEKCPDWKFWFTKEELKWLFKWIYTNFYKDSKENIYIFNKNFILKNKNEVINFKKKNIELFEWADSAFSNMWVYNDKLWFSFLYLDKKNNTEYQKLNCDKIIKKEDECEEISLKENNNEKYLNCYEKLEQDKNYNKCIDLLYDTKFIKNDTYYNYYFLDQKYNLDSSEKIFIYNWKIGFIAEKNKKKYIIFDWKKITKSFDDIHTKTCCISLPYPFYVLKNGLLAFVFKRDWEYFIWYSYLNWKEKSNKEIEIDIKKELEKELGKLDWLNLEKEEKNRKKLNKDFEEKINKKVSKLKALNFKIDFLKEPKKLEKLWFFKKDFDKVNDDVIWNYFDKNTSYYKIANLDFENEKWELILLNASAFYSMWWDMLYFVKYKNKYYFLPSISTWWQDYYSKENFLDLKDFSKKFIKKNIEFFEEEKFKKILDIYKIPKEINFTKNNKNYNLKLLTKKTYFFSKDILQNLKKIDFIKWFDNLYVEKSWEKIWWDKNHIELEKLRNNDFDKFEELDKKIKDNFFALDRKIDFFKSDAIFMKMPDNTVAVYNLEIPFESKKEHIYPSWWMQLDNWITLIENWKEQNVFYYSYKENSSCWIKDWTYMYVPNWKYKFEKYRILIWDKKWENYDIDKIKQKDTIFYYKNNELKKIWEFIRNDWKKEDAFILYEKSNFMKAMYKYWYYTQLDDYWCLDEKWEFRKNDEECGYQDFLDYQNFVKIKPLLFWKDPFWRDILFLSWNVSQPSACWAKPVIYLYPEKKQNIKVKLNWKANNLFTIPEYGKSWEVISDKNSKIYDLKTRKTYPYLFWEDFMKYKIPEKWFIVKKENLENFFDEKLSYINLNKKEISDFKNYWIPKMQDYSYYFVTFLQTRELNKIVPIEIYPKPDNIWRIFMDFKWLDRFRKVQELKLERFKRKWFFVVEWWWNKK